MLFVEGSEPQVFMNCYACNEYVLYLKVLMCCLSVRPDVRCDPPASKIETHKAHLFENHFKIIPMALRSHTEEKLKLRNRRNMNNMISKQPYQFCRAFIALFLNLCFKSWIELHYMV